MELPLIYPITDARISGLSHAEQVERLIEGGAKLIQIREKHSSTAEYLATAKTAVDIARARNVRIIINDRVDIALALKADGVHLGQDDLPPEKAREILGPLAIIGFSTHTIAQVKAALSLPIDYIAFGPIFPTKTKEEPDEIVGLQALRQVSEMADEMPVVAIGGLNESNIRSVFEAGADSTALIRALLSNPTRIVSRMEFLHNIVND